ncbi:hypothetical protein RCO48_37675 [Peribacillus frigoritolerans]|nr:hypothetical protein [Peribacillus frigoritolerans]
MKKNLYKIGVVGPLSSIKKIRDVTNEFEHEIDFIDFPYEDAREVTDIIKKSPKCSKWLVFL